MRLSPSTEKRVVCTNPKQNERCEQNERCKPWPPIPVNYEWLTIECPVFSPGKNNEQE